MTGGLRRCTARVNCTQLLICFFFLSHVHNTCMRLYYAYELNTVQVYECIQCFGVCGYVWFSLRIFMLTQSTYLCRFKLLCVRICGIRNKITTSLLRNTIQLVLHDECGSLNRSRQTRVNTLNRLNCCCFSLYAANTDKHTRRHNLTFYRHLNQNSNFHFYLLFQSARFVIFMI